MEGTANFNEDRTCRYSLTRYWGTGTNWLVCFGLNPSTADEVKDDPTIRKMVGFSKRWGHDGLIMLNMFPHVMTDSKKLVIWHNVGENLIEIEKYIVRECVTKVVLAWGAHKAIRCCLESSFVSSLYRIRPGKSLWSFGLTKEGHPKHPLYLPYTTQLVEYPYIP